MEIPEYGYRPAPRGSMDANRTARRGRARRALAPMLSAGLIYLLTGCLAVTHTQPPSKPYVPTAWPLTFKQHDFAAHCYNTQRCSVVYDNNNFTRSAADAPSGAPPAPDYREHWKNASFLGVNNFPPPAEVRWTALDGSEHEAKVDLAEIFKDQRILHRVAREDIPDGWGQDVRPNIYVEVNDRTVSVLMRAHVATRQPQIAGNAYSNFRNDTILAWSKTY